MYKERLISNSLILIVVSVFEFIFFHTGDTVSSVVAWIIFGFCLIGIGSVFMEVYPPKLKKEVNGNYLKNTLIYFLLGITTFLINYSFFGITLLAVSFFIAGIVNFIFGFIYGNRK